MDVQTVNPSGITRTGIDTRLDSFFAGDLNLRTQEGDLVRISVGSQYSFAQSGSQTLSGQGDVSQEISLTAQAASRYSFSVQGELSADELNAIQTLVEELDPIATAFFNNQELDLENATASLTDNLGVVEELEVGFQKTVRATFSFQQTSILPAGASTVAENSEPVSGDGEAIPAENVRDLPGLVFAALETQLNAKAAQTQQAKHIMNSLQDLLNFLRQRFSIFTPLGQQPLESLEAEGSGAGSEIANPAVETPAASQTVRVSTEI